jgi:hypothetical protein
MSKPKNFLRLAIAKRRLDATTRLGVAYNCSLHAIEDTLNKRYVIATYQSALEGVDVDALGDFEAFYRALKRLGEGDELPPFVCLLDEQGDFVYEVED